MMQLNVSFTEYVTKGKDVADEWDRSKDSALGYTRVKREMLG